MPATTEAIREIELIDVLPRVFVREAERKSDVWRTRCGFSRPGRYMVEAESGTGKSSLCAYIFGSRSDYEGEILFNGTDIRSFTVEQWQEIRRRHIAYLPQELSLFPELTAMQNIRLKNDLTSHATDGRIGGWLQKLGIDSRRDFPVGRMSIGQQQRVAIIRAICQPFDFLLIDEPVSHLDSGNNRLAAEIVAEEADRQGAAIIATSVGTRILLDNLNYLSL